jgi:hypothetical protein
MKTPTLIVRLCGLYLLVQCTITLLQLQRMGAMSGGMALRQNPVTGDIQLYALAGWVSGLAAILFAGPLARILTFDSDPKE